MYLEVKIEAGETIDQAIRDTIALANRMGITLYFEFNGVKMFVSPNSSFRARLDYYNNFQNELFNQRNKAARATLGDIPEMILSFEHDTKRE